MFFNLNKINGSVVGHSEEYKIFNDHCICVESSAITITENTVQVGDNSFITYTYTPSVIPLADYKIASINHVQAQPLAVSEVEVHAGVFLDDTHENLKLLQLKNDVGTSATIIDKYYNVTTLNKSDLTNALSNLTKSISDKIDFKNTTITNVLSSTSIENIATQLFISERTINLMVDVDGDVFDDINNKNNQSTNTVVMPSSGVLNLADVSWLSNVVGVKSINSSQSTVQVVDSNAVHTANLTFDKISPVINGDVVENGLPVVLTLIVYERI